jgi:hypothetical protein
MYIAAAIAVMIRRVDIPAPPRNTIDQVCRNVIEWLLLLLYCNRIRPSPDTGDGDAENVKGKYSTLSVFPFPDHMTESNNFHLP